jgi:hypothetical protein
MLRDTHERNWREAGVLNPQRDHRTGLAPAYSNFSSPHLCYFLLLVLCIACIAPTIRSRSKEDNIVVSNKLII